MNDTSLSISDGYEGQLREEITIQSNLILTLERKEERYTADPAEGRMRFDAHQIAIAISTRKLIHFCDAFQLLQHNEWKIFVSLWSVLS
jgi:hypothetical protein